MTENRLFNKLDRVVDMLTRACVVIASVSLLSIVIVIVVHTLDRKYFQQLGWIFVDEWSGYLFVLIVFFSMALTLRSGDSHIKVSLMSRFVSRRVWSVAETITLFLAVPVLSFMTYSSISRLLSMLEGGIRNNTPLMTPLWIPYTFIAVGLSVFTLAVAVHLVRKVIIAATGGEEGTGAGMVDSEIGGQT